jgi:hypothetical protein
METLNLILKERPLFIAMLVATCIGLNACQTTKSVPTSDVKVAEAASTESSESPFIQVVADRAGRSIDIRTLERDIMDLDRHLVREFASGLSIVYKSNRGELRNYSDLDEQTEFRSLNELQDPPGLPEEELRQKALQQFRELFLVESITDWQPGKIIRTSPQSSEPGQVIFHYEQFQNGYKIHSGNFFHIAVRSDTGQVLDAAYINDYEGETPVLNYSPEQAMSIAQAELRKQNRTPIQAKYHRTVYQVGDSYDGRKAKVKERMRLGILVLCHHVSVTATDGLGHTFSISTKSGEIIAQNAMLPNVADPTQQPAKR